MPLQGGLLLAALPNLYLNESPVNYVTDGNALSTYLISQESQKMDINTETEIKQKHSLTPFPVFLISLAFRGRYFHSHFQEFSHERLLHSGSS